MVQSPSWAANWFAASQEIPCISRNPKVHYILPHKIMFACSHTYPTDLNQTGYVTLLLWTRFFSGVSFILNIVSNQNLSICPSVHTGWVSHPFQFPATTGDCLPVDSFKVKKLHFPTRHHCMVLDRVSYWSFPFTVCVLRWTVTRCRVSVFLAINPHTYKPTQLIHYLHMHQPCSQHRHIRPICSVILIRPTYHVVRALRTMYPLICVGCCPTR